MCTRSRILGAEQTIPVIDNVSTVTSAEKATVYDAVVKGYQGMSNFKLIMTKPFRDKIVALVSYDILNQHFVDYRFVEQRNGELKLLGGGGGVAQYTMEKPVTFSGGGSSYSEDEPPYFFAYGEVFDDRIKSIRATFSNGSVVTDTRY